MSLNKFEELFQIKKPVIGMIHLAGEKHEKVKIALEELFIYQEEGVDGAIIEDYHGSADHIYDVLEASKKLDFKIIKGVNVLIDPYSGFDLVPHFNVKFIQFDSIQPPSLNPERYDELREKYQNIIVLGGVGFKYIPPTGNPLEQDLKEAMQRCDTIVTTGTGTGIETPINKLRQYKNLLYNFNNFPLVVGAGVNLENVLQQLEIADGAIIGSYFKPENNTYLKVDRNRVKSLMDVVKDLRNDYQ